MARVAWWSWELRRRRIKCESKFDLAFEEWIQAKLTPVKAQISIHETDASIWAFLLRICKFFPIEPAESNSAAAYLRLLSIGLRAGDTSLPHLVWVDGRKIVSSSSASAVWRWVDQHESIEVNILFDPMLNGRMTRFIKDTNERWSKTTFNINQIQHLLNDRLRKEMKVA